jgi:hypothetical protein
VPEISAKDETLHDAAIKSRQQSHCGTGVHFESTLRSIAPNEDNMSVLGAARGN